MLYTDIMLDMETLGTKPGSMIRTIALVAFNRHNPGKLGDELSLRLDLREQGRLGMKIDADTFLWWLEQSDEARAAMVSKHDVRSPVSAAIEIENFVNARLHPSGVVWAKSPRFDCALLEDLFTRLGHDRLPWHFAAEDDVRTIMRLVGDTSRPPKEAHDALADARHQAQVVQRCWEKLQAVRLDGM